MQKTVQTWVNLTSKNPKPAKTYGINNSSTTIAHLQVHEVTPTEQNHYSNPAHIFMTISTYDCDFILLQNPYETGTLRDDPELKEELRVRTNYPIMHCQLEYQYFASHLKDCLVGYLIDIYSNVYSFNFTQNIQVNDKYSAHPMKYSTMFQNMGLREVDLSNKLYLQTPLMVKYHNRSLVFVNLASQLHFLDFNQSISGIGTRPDEIETQKTQLGQVALAAAHNRTKCSKYESIIVVAVNNSKAPYLFVNCNSSADFENQKKFQDKYEWTEDQMEVTFCSIDPLTNFVVVSTVSQNIAMYEIQSTKDENSVFYYLKKRFSFFLGNNLYVSIPNLDYNIEGIHANKGLVMVVTCKEYIIYDLVHKAIKKRGNGNAIAMLKWGNIIDRNENLAGFILAKGFNFINDAHSKMGKPNLHFKTVDLSKRDRRF